MAKTKKQKEAERQARVDQIARLMAENERELQQKAQRMAEECDAVTGMSLCLGYATQLLVIEACRQTARCGTAFGKKVNGNSRVTINTVLPDLNRAKTNLNTYFETFELFLGRNAADPALGTAGFNQYQKWAHEIAELACMYMNAEMSCPHILELVRPVLLGKTTQDGIFLSDKTISKLRLQTRPNEEQ